MDKSWINLPNRTSQSYIDGVDKFLDFAFENNDPSDTRIYCPCKKCYNRFFVVRDVAREHLIVTGFLPNYKNWTSHGEPFISLHGNRSDDGRIDINVGDDMVGMVHEAMGIPNIDVTQGNDQTRGNEHGEGPNEETTKFLKLLQEAESPLYEGCQKFSALSFIVRLLHLKVLNGWTDKSFTMLLELLKDAFPEGVLLPKSYYEANKITTDLGFTCKTWDACPNNCMLFRGNDENLDTCEICETSRYKQFEGGSNDGTSGDQKIAAKQVRYFPLKPRLQRLFMSSKTASLMKWHAGERIDDGVQRHPADSQAWKAFDEKHPEFASDSRNVRLGLASDGFNPFRTMSIAHSTWPVVLMPYNLPPWLCMKQPFFILSVLIDGPKGPGNKIDVYLEPLIEELKELWTEGVLTYDASSNQMFKLHASLLWTINDFPAYANLSGWSTKGEYACPCCNKEKKSRWLKHGRKHCYLGHRRFLPMNHRLRKDKVSFDGRWELGRKPIRLSGSDILQQLDGVLTEYKKEDIRKRKNDESRKGKDQTTKYGWKKKSIFFELPYWEHNLIRHNLDCMHIEKNVCDNVLWTLLGVPGKSKDSLKARLDLKDMGIRKPLHPQSRGSNKAYLSAACFTMSKEDKDVFLKVLKGIKVPDGYASNISRCVHLKERSIWGLKSHDSHILMQQLLPLAIRKALSKNVVEALIELSNFFRQLCSKVNKASDLEYIQDRIALTLCQLEKIFPPSFFDIMEHLPIHLVEEALIAGAIQFRWMYPIERYLLTLKLYVRNRAHPEASIAKGYLMEECMNFCARYLNDVETKSNRPTRNYDGDNNTGRHVGKGVRFRLDEISYEQAHRYVLENTEAVDPFRTEHIDVLEKLMPRAGSHQIQKVHHETFQTWFKEYVGNAKTTNNVKFSEEIEKLAVGPDVYARRYDIYDINGFRFRTMRRDTSRTTQNSGVTLKAETMSFASTKDRNPRSGDVAFYGRLTDIIELRYTNSLKFVLFKCDWVDNQTGKMEDEFKFTLVNFNNLLYRHNRLGDEPFILSTQAEQVCYVQDPVDPNWHVVVKMTVRDLFDMYSKDCSSMRKSIPQAEPFAPQQFDERTYIRDDDVGWVRANVEGTTVDTNVAVGDDVEMEECD